VQLSSSQFLSTPFGEAKLLTTTVFNAAVGKLVTSGIGVSCAMLTDAGK
jgi:hypothetical protein